MKKLAIFTIVIAALSAGADEIEWLATSYDFGSFKEAGGKKTGEVKFVNRGKEATIINRVKPTCGCTVAEYTEGEIAPGDTATVSFTYNPAGRPGRFQKHIKVYTGTDNLLTSIEITGTVIGAPQTLEKEYPVVLGDLRLSQSSLQLGHIVSGNSRNEFLHGYNQSADTLHIGWSDVPKSMSLGVSSRNIAPGDIFTLSVFCTTIDTELGTNEAEFKLYPSIADKSAYLPVKVSYVVDPDLSKINAQQLSESATATLYPTVIDMDEINGNGSRLKREFGLVNDGKSELRIIRVHSPYEAIAIKSFPKKLKPGKTGVIKVEVDPKKVPSGLFNVPIEVVTNDPLHPTKEVRIVGNCVQPSEE